MSVRKRIVRIWDMPAGGVLPALTVVSAAFVLGGVLGCALATQVDGGGSDTLSAYIKGYLAVAQSGAVASPHILSTIWTTVRWPLFAIFMGFTALGVLGVPVLFSMRGFLLSFAITSFVRMFGGAGGVLAFLAFGITGLVAIPVLFVLGVQSFAAARLLAGRFLKDNKRALPFGRAYWMRCGVCCTVLCLCVLLEYAVVPALIQTVAPLF